MIILLFVSILLGLISLFIMIKTEFEIIGGMILSIAIGGILFSGSGVVAGYLEIKTLREKMKNPQHFTSKDIAEINNDIAEIKAMPFLYFGFDISEIDYIDIDSASSMKIEIEENVK